MTKKKAVISGEEMTAYCDQGEGRRENKRGEQAEELILGSLAGEASGGNGDTRSAWRTGTLGGRVCRFKGIREYSFTVSITPPVAISVSLLSACWLSSQDTALGTFALSAER